LHPITPTRPTTPSGKALMGTRFANPSSVTMRSQGALDFCPLQDQIHYPIQNPLERIIQNNSNYMKKKMHADLSHHFETQSKTGASYP